MEQFQILKQELLNLSNLTKKETLQKFFKTGKGDYAEYDKFIGVIVPEQRKIAKKFIDIPLNSLKKLFTDDIHEVRLTAFIILTYKFAKAKTIDEKQKIVDTYIKNYKGINNWDLVDLTADKLLGAFAFEQPAYKKIIFDFANSNHLWKQRIAIVSTFYFIKNNDFTDTLKISEILLTHNHDLIQKAVGWMLREIGKRSLKTELDFLDKFAKLMPRVMLRYAIEKFDNNLKQKYLIQQKIK